MTTFEKIMDEIFERHEDKYPDYPYEPTINIYTNGEYEMSEYDGRIISYDYTEIEPHCYDLDIEVDEFRESEMC